MVAYECQSCAHRRRMPHLPPCVMCSRRYSLHWEPIRAGDSVTQSQEVAP